MRKFLKAAIPSILLAFLFWNIAKDWQTVIQYWSNFAIVPFLVSFVFLLADYPEGALGWHIILRKMGINISFLRSLRIWILSTASRYVPGSIWQFIGRVELAQREGITRSKTIASLLLEVFLVLVAGVFMSLLALPFVKLHQLGIGIWIFLLPFPLLLLHPKIANRIIGLLARVSKRDIRKIDVSLSFSDTISAFPWFAVNFLINGIALFFLVTALVGTIEPFWLIAYTGFYALSWVLGYVALFAPAGVGVTEVSLAYLLSFSMPFSLASTIALSYRFFLTIAEILVFLFVLKIRK